MLKRVLRRVTRNTMNKAATLSECSRLYLQGLSMVKIARRLHWDSNRVRNLLIKDGTPIKKRGEAGAAHPSWKGNKVKPDTGRVRCKRLYPELGNCENCLNKPAIERHHKNGNTTDNERSNVLFVCRQCHMKLDGRWEKFRAWQKILRERNRKPPRPCRTCHRLTTRHLHEECPQCAMYRRRNGKARPLGFDSQQSRIARKRFPSPACIVPL